MIPSFKQYLVEEEREIFFTFGRMNPPTIGHGKLMDVLMKKAGRNPYKIYLSQSQDPKKNPLSYQQKVKHTRKMFPQHARNVLLNKKVKTVFDAATSLHDQGYKRVTMVVGADRITEFQTLLNKYNGVKGRHGFYNFEKISIVSAGDRDPDAEGVEGMSASKQRDNASRNDFTTFTQGVPSKMSNNDARRLFNDIRVGMGLKEAVNFKRHLDLKPVSETREKYIAGELFEPGDRVVVKESNATGYVYRLGANHVIVALDEGKVTRQWLDGIVREEKTDRWYKDQPEWGTPEATKKAMKNVQPKIKEDQVQVARQKIDREKKNDKIKHDKMLDRARTARARTRNRVTNPMKESDKMGRTNPVAKYSSKFNKAKVEPDKKKEMKKGYTKHKDSYK